MQILVNFVSLGKTPWITPEVLGAWGVKVSEKELWHH